MKGTGLQRPGWGKWGIVSLRFVVLLSLLLYTYLGRRAASPERVDAGAWQDLVDLGPEFWLLAGVFLATNVAFAFEAVEAFISQRIAGWIFVFDVSLVCAMGYYGGEVSPEFYLAYFLTIMVAAASRTQVFALGGALVGGAVFALMRIRGATFEEVMGGQFAAFVIFVIATGLMMGTLAGLVRRLLGQRFGIRRALSLSSQLGALFDLSRVEDSESRMLASFAEDIGREVFLADEALLLRPRDDDDAQQLLGAGWEAVPALAQEAFRRRQSLRVVEPAREEHPDLPHPHSALAVPITFEGTIYGVLWLSRQDPTVPPLDEDDERLAEAIARHVGVAMHNARLLATVESARRKTEETLNQLQETQDRLLRTEKLSAVGEIVSRVALELNAPLTGILGTAELLSEQVGPTLALQRGLATIQRDATRCRALVTSLVKAVGRSKATRIPTDLNLLLMEVVSKEMPRLNEAGITVEQDLSNKIPLLVLDRVQISRVITHVIDNSCRAMLRNTDGPRRLSVRSRVKGERVQVSVEDSGPGINLDHLLQVFQPFYPGSSPEDGGSTAHPGLGLAAAHTALKDHGGSVRATTYGDGGTTITLDFPVAGLQVAPPDVPGPGDRPCRLLVLENDTSVLEVITEALGAHVEILHAATLPQAVQRMQSGSGVDAALVEIEVSGSSPREMHEALTSREPRLGKRVLWTGAASVSEAAEEIITRSGGTFLAKPYSATDLRVAVGGLLGVTITPSGPETHPASSA